METISWFHPGVPGKKKLFEAYRELIGLSNSFFMTSSEADIYSRNREYVLNIKKDIFKVIKDRDKSLNTKEIEELLQNCDEHTDREVEVPEGVG
mgnify:CR=1 FL=1